MNSKADSTIPRTDGLIASVCPYCGAKSNFHSVIYWECHSGFKQRSLLCIQRERAINAEREVERLNGLLSDLLILTEKHYWNSTNYNQIKESHHAYK